MQFTSSNFLYVQPSVSTHYCIAVTKFEFKFLLEDERSLRFTIMEDNIVVMDISVVKPPKTSIIRHHAQKFSINSNTPRRTITRELHLDSYKIQLTEE